MEKSMKAAVFTWDGGCETVIEYHTPHSGCLYCDASLNTDHQSLKHDILTDAVSCISRNDHVPMFGIGGNHTMAAPGVHLHNLYVSPSC